MWSGRARFLTGALPASGLEQLRARNIQTSPMCSVSGFDHELLSDMEHTRMIFRGTLLGLTLKRQRLGCLSFIGERAYAQHHWPNGCQRYKLF